MAKYKEGVMIEIDYPEDGDITQLDLSQKTLKHIEDNKSGTTEGFGISYYILSDYLNEIEDEDMNKITEDCNITEWDEEDQSFYKDVKEHSMNIGIDYNKLLEILGVE